MTVIEFPLIPLGDIPARLRKLANEVEDGGHGEATAALVILPRPGDFPAVFGFGNVDGDYSPMIQLQLALYWFTQNLVNRT